MKFQCVLRFRCKLECATYRNTGGRWEVGGVPRTCFRQNHVVTRLTWTTKRRASSLSLPPWAHHAHMEHGDLRRLSSTTLYTRKKNGAKLEKGGGRTFL